MKFSCDNARQIDISGNSMLVLNKPESIYLITSQSLHIFVVPLREGRPAGVRRFLFQAEKGSLLFGLDPEGHGTGLGLIATGKPGSSVLEASRDLLKKASESQETESCQQARTLVRGWTTNLTISLERGIPPKKTFLLEPGNHVLQPDWHARIKSEYRQLWIKHTQGASRYFSGPDHLISEQEGFLPFSEQAWITCETEASLECLSEKQYQRTDPGYKALEGFHRLFLRVLKDRQKTREREERVRQEEMILKDRARLNSTLHLLAESMEAGKKGIPFKSEPGSELLSACRMVGEEAGIEVHEPPAEARINNDPLQAIANGSNFRIRKVSLKDEWWKYDGGPMLGYRIDPETEEKHPVSLLQTSPGTYVMVDPRTGARRRIDKKTDQELFFFAYTFYRPLPDRPLKVMDMVRAGFLGLRRDQITVFLMGIAAGLFGVLPPIANGIIFDSVIPEADRGGLLYLGAILISAAVATGFFETTKIFSTMRLVGKSDSRLQSGVMDRLLSLPTPFFRNFTAGDLAERALGINAIREILSGATLSSIIGGIFSVFSLALLFYYSWRLALVAVGITLVSVTIVAAVGYIQIRHQRSIHKLQGKLSGMVLQLISGISKLRVSGTEERAFSAWAETFSSMRKSSFKATKITNHLQAFTLALPAISLFVIFGWIVFTPLMKSMSVGNIIAFYSAFTQFQMALTQMALTLVSSLQVIPLYERAKPILDATPEVDPAKAGPGELSGHIEVNNLYFRYDPDGPLILKDVSIEVHPGQFVAVVGSSGSGKSTLLRLLLGFERPESGSIYYDSQDLDTLNVVAVRRQFGVVLQNGSVMPGDFFSNIVGSSSLSIDDAWMAARMAGLEKDIQAMPMGMHTMITPGGGTLSGGQRQRLLIARAVVHKPRILYFDEATSALDNTTQKIVSQSLEQLNATRVVIAHRLSTIEKADRIFVLDKGRLLQQGTYHELVNKPGLFAKLAERQMV